MEADKRPSNPQGAAPDLYQKAAEVGKDALDDQVAELDSMRTRSVQFLSFVGTATAFLVGTAIKGSVDRGPWFGLVGGIATLGVFLLLWLLRSILTGTKTWRGGGPMDWRYRSDPTALTEWLDEHGTRMTEPTFYRYLASVYREQKLANDVYLDIIRKRYLAFLFLATIELLAWGALAWGYGYGTSG